MKRAEEVDMNDQTMKTGIPNEQRIFVNRSLNFGNVKIIGFDMDHTLAPYKKENFEALAFQATLTKFIEAGYPEELSTLAYKNDFVIRGLIVDIDRGNILKVDGYKYVKDAYHGYKRLNKETRDALYNRQGFRAQDFHSIDTFFALSEVQLFLEIVNYMDHNPGKIDKSFTQVYADLRKFIDLSHQDDSIKKKVIESPEKYIEKNKYLATTLVRLADAGKTLFLLTNSDYTYTNHIMNFVLSNTHEEFPDWKDFWNYIIVGSGKPGFFVGSQPFFEVIDDSGLLKIHRGNLNPFSVYYGGNAKLFEKLTSYQGDEVLYIGDHIYGDIIQSKGAVNWRTMLIINELEDEIKKLDEGMQYTKLIDKKLIERETLDEELQKIRSMMAANRRLAKKAQKKGDLKKIQSLLAANDSLTNKLNNKKESLKSIEESIKTNISDRSTMFHPVWGELMKVGFERSRFANQVCNYACIYSSQVSNLRFYSPYKKFVSYHESLPHEE